MNRRLWLLLFVVSLIAAACTSEGLPADFADQDRRTENQFVSACNTSLDGGEVDLGEGYCQCAFYTLAVELEFEDFIALDERLREDPGSLSLEDRNLIESISLPCSFSEEDVYG